MLTITGCRTTKVIEVELPPKPAREEKEAPKDLKEVTELLNYYEHLVELWENWGERVEAILTEEQK